MKKYIKVLMTSSLIALGLLSYPVHNKIHASTAPTRTIRLGAVNYNRRAEPRVRQSITHLAHQRSKYHFKNISWNFRDIGGYNTYNHKYHVKTGKLYLSSYINKLHKNGARQLRKLHVHTDIDMRNYYGSPTAIRNHPQPGEMKLRRNNLHLHMRYLHYPVSSSKEEEHNWSTVKSRTQNDYYYEIHHFRGQYLLPRTARKAYHNSFLAVMKYTNHHNAVMFNCNSGRDRSACFAALILGVLGVNKSTIQRNYLLTNYYSYQTPYTNQAKRIQAFYGTIKRHYHSIHGYATSKRGLNLSRHFISRFRHRFLVRN